MTTHRCLLIALRHPPHPLPPTGSHRGPVILLFDGESLGLIPKFTGQELG